MPRFRPTARLLVLDPAGRILLFSAEDPRGRVWFTPGGGVHGGESLEAAAVRELAEETGHVRGLSDLVERLLRDDLPATPVRLPRRPAPEEQAPEDQVAEEPVP